MRIIAGKYKGRQLLYKSKNLRPTSDKAREALFSILGDRVSDSRFLDLYAGSGAVGLEALSRGAEQAFFVEKFPKLVHSNLHSLGLVAQAQVLRFDVQKALVMLSKKAASFDIIFLDPPYELPTYDKVLDTIGNSGLLSPQGILIAEHRSSKTLDSQYGSLQQSKHNKYGESSFSFYSYL